MWHVVCDFLFELCLSSEFTETSMFRKLVLFPSSGERGHFLSRHSTMRPIGIMDFAYLLLI
jgi:hypothetical protein